jgi:hypothetical protein
MASIGASEVVTALDCGLGRLGDVAVLFSIGRAGRWLRGASS